MKHKLRYIGVDFDGTIVDTVEYPKIGELRTNAKNTLDYLKEQGFVLVLWTCREGKDLKNAIKFLKDNDIEFDYINENPKELQEVYNNDPRKLGVDVFIDDKNFNIITGDSIDWTLIKFTAELKWECVTLDEYTKR